MGISNIEGNYISTIFGQVGIGLPQWVDVLQSYLSSGPPAWWTDMDGAATPGDGYFDCTSVGTYDIFRVPRGIHAINVQYCIGGGGGGGDGTDSGNGGSGGGGGSGGWYVNIPYSVNYNDLVTVSVGSGGGTNGGGADSYVSINGNIVLVGHGGNPGQNGGPGFGGSGGAPGSGNSGNSGGNGASGGGDRGSAAGGQGADGPFGGGGAQGVPFVSQPAVNGGNGSNYGAGGGGAGEWDRTGSGVWFGGSGFQGRVIVQY